MSISISNLTQEQALKIMATEEGQFSDVKAVGIAPAKLTKTVSAFANTDGGDVYVGSQEAAGWRPGLLCVASDEPYFCINSKRFYTKKREAPGDIPAVCHQGGGEDSVITFL